MLDLETRRELADFLKMRRSSLSPTDFGFPSGQRRRARGLRREEVAAAAGVGLTWYTALEQGKPIQVSATFLESVARALCLCSGERLHLYALAHRRPPPFSAQIRSESDEKRLQAILDGIAVPAYARSDRFDVLAWNNANTEWFGDFSAIPAEKRNVIRLMFTRPHYRRSMPDWEADARALVATFRLAFSQAENAETFLPLISELQAVSADFSRMWAAHEVSDLGEGVTRLTSRRIGEVRFQHQLLMPEGMLHARIVMYLPLERAVPNRLARGKLR